MCTTNLFHVKFNGDIIFQFWWFHQQLFTDLYTEVFESAEVILSTQIENRMLPTVMMHWCTDESHDIFD